MKKTTLLLSAMILVASFGCGSSEKAAATDDKALRDSVTNPPKFDINNVPPENREKVRQMMGGGAGASYGKSSGTPTAPPAGSPGGTN